MHIQTRILAGTATQRTSTVQNNRCETDPVRAKEMSFDDCYPAPRRSRTPDLRQPSTAAQPSKIIPGFPTTTASLHFRSESVRLRNFDVPPKKALKVSKQDCQPLLLKQPSNHRQNGTPFRSRPPPCCRLQIPNQNRYAEGCREIERVRKAKRI